MTFDWREYLELAKELAGQVSSGYTQEAAQRSAVSRAYYAAFCWARNYAKAKLGFQPTRKSKDHSLLRDYLRRQGRLKLASDLKKLSMWRNQCDYDNQVSNLTALVSNAMSLADKAIQTCR